MKKVKIYSLPACGECVIAKRFFEENDIEYEEIDVSNGYIQQEFIKKTRQIKVPVIEINNVYITGFDKDAILNNLKINEEEDNTKTSKEEIKEKIKKEKT